MTARTKTANKQFSVDRLMRNVASSLVRDFRTNLSDVSFCSEFLTALRTGTIADIRRLAPIVNDNMSVAEYKATYQMSSLFKRFRFENDLFSDDELTDKAISAFQDTQSRLANLDLDSLDTVSKEILNRAASYIAFVLGEYNDEVHRNLCRFGRKASVGIPARLACEAARWELPISGSPEQIAWFDSEMSLVPCVQNYWQRQLESDPSEKKRSIYRATSSLALTLVPKTFKSLRSIMPNTTIGTYMSYGLGEMIRKGLKREGYDIRSLQMRHRYLAQSGSIHKLYTTADLSSASDSISVALVKRLFPPDWFDILSQSRIGKVALPDGTCVESQTFCTMGIGYTFPLQTLVFLALLKAIESCFWASNNRRTISVYGDDLIYSSRMHWYVSHYLPKFGFILNVEKTFSEGHFRESCGGDYFHGVDVRPFQPRSGPANVGSKSYEAILYKLVNTLLARWSEYEIGGTLDFLTSEVESVCGKCKLVPSDFPDDAGIKTSLPLRQEFLLRSTVSLPKFVGHGVYRFSYLRFQSELRKEVRHEPYYWARLRGHDQPLFTYSGRHVANPSAVAARIDELVGTKVSDLLILKEDHPIVTFRSRLTGRRLRRLSTYVVTSHTGSYKRQSGTSCFEDRR